MADIEEDPRVEEVHDDDSDDCPSLVDGAPAEVILELIGVLFMILLGTSWSWWCQLEQRWTEGAEGYTENGYEANLRSRSSRDEEIKKHALRYC